MKKVIVIGCPGAGKSTFSRKLSAKTGLPIHYLDMIWHLPDKTTLSRDEFIKRLDEIVAQPEWIIDGNYLHTLPLRLSHCDTVFYFDLPFNICLAGAEERVAANVRICLGARKLWTRNFVNGSSTFPRNRPR